MKTRGGSAAQLEAQSLSPARSRQRFVLIGLLFLHTVNTYVDRVCISVAAPEMQRDLGLSNQEMGYVFGVFSLAYGLFQIPAGWAADTYGPRRSLACVVAMWSLFTALTGAAMNMVSLLGIRFLFGVAEAGAFPGATRALYNWVPVKERGLAQGIFHSGARVGAAMSFFLIPFLIGLFGWRMTFVVCGLAGFAWVTAWWLWFRDKPEAQPRVNAAELELIQSGQTSEFAEAQPVPLGQALASTNMLVLMFQALAGNFTFNLTVSWLMPYLVEKWGTEAKVYAALPPILSTFSLWASGWLVSWLYERGYHVGSRKGVGIVGSALGGAAMLLLTQADSVVAFILLYSAAFFCVEATLAPKWTMCMDIGGAKSGAVSAAMNMFGNVGAALSSVMFPFFIAHVTMPFFAERAGTANSYFVFAAVMNLLSAVSWFLINPRRKLTEAMTARQVRLRVYLIIGGLMLLSGGVIVWQSFFAK